MKKVNTRNLVLTALLGALAYVFMLLRFPLPFMPPFMDFDFAPIAEMIGAFSMGPVAGVVIVGIKVFLKLVTTGTGSAFTGEIQNFILHSAFVLTAALIYRRNMTYKSAILGMIAGTLVSASVAVLTNMYIIIPFYAKLYGLNMDAIVEMVKKVNRFVDSELKFVLLGIIPFNIIKWSVTTIVLSIAYPRLPKLLRFTNKAEVSMS